jgi:hypothetical protein
VTIILALLTLAVALWVGFATPPSARSVLALAGGAVAFFLAALGAYGWGIAWMVSLLGIAAPVAAARMAATKWSTPDIYDE